MSRVCDEIWSGLGLNDAKFPQVVAIVGSGGKTSLMGQLARAGKARSLRVAVLTTTHIFEPSVYREAFFDIKPGTIAVFGRGCGDGKISFPGKYCYEEICRGADLILVEADGSRGMPVKYPGPREPVIPGDVDRIVCVVGLSGLDRPGRECCHRWELALQALTVHSPEVFRHLPERKAKEEIEYEEQITEEILSVLLEEGYGKPLTQQFPRTDFYYCMNQADTAAKCQAAEQILRKVNRKGMIVSMKDEENILYRKERNAKKRIAFIYMASGFGVRYGSNKLLETVDDKPLYCHGLLALTEAAKMLNGKQGLEMLSLADDREEPDSIVHEASEALEAQVIVVSQYEEILKRAREMGAVSVYNPNGREGITASIRLGIQEAGRGKDHSRGEPDRNGPDSPKPVQSPDAYLFAVADQPWLRAESIVRLTEEFFKSHKTMACLTDGTRPGNPVIFSAVYEEELLSLTGDKGGSRILKRYPKEVLKVQVPGEELLDIDSPADA